MKKIKEISFDYNGISYIELVGREHYGG